MKRKFEVTVEAEDRYMQHIDATEIDAYLTDEVYGMGKAFTVTVKPLEVEE